MKKFLCIVLSAVCFAALLCGCGKEEPERGYTFYTYSMNGDALLYLNETRGGDTDARAEALWGEVCATLEEIESSLTVTADSDISRFNSAAAGGRVQIGKTAYEALSVALDEYKFTGGFYNPAVYYGVEAFGFNGSGKKPASAEELPSPELTGKYAELAACFGETQLIAEDGGYFAVKPSKTVEVDGKTLSLKIDLGGIGKGYAADKVGGLLFERGFDYAYFNFASSSLSIKNYSPENKDFNLGLINPRGGYEEIYIKTAVRDSAVSTSGDYENYFVLDGTRYCHIFDPFTCRPVQSGIMSATVIGGTAAENDALTTAIMAMDPDSAVRFIGQKLGDRKVFFTCNAGGNSYYYTNVPQGGFELAENCPFAPYTGAQNVA